jgi:hypothetical protein
LEGTSHGKAPVLDSTCGLFSSKDCGHGSLFGDHSVGLVVEKPQDISRGWWLSLPPLKNDGVKVSWDDEIPNIWKNKKCSKLKPVIVFCYELQ